MPFIATVLPSLLASLVSIAREQMPATVDVRYGYGVSGDPGDFLMIGVDDPDRTDAAESAQSVQKWAHANHTDRDEEGTVTCAALSWNGDGSSAGQQMATETAFGMLDGFAQSLRNDYTAGDVPGLLWVEFGTSMSLSQNQTDDGAWSLVVFELHFRARI